MIETSETLTVELDMVRQDTGECVAIQAQQKNSKTYYSIKNITTRINNMTFLTVLEKTCKSAKDISIVKELLEGHDKDNRVFIPNITAKAKELGISRVKLTKLLKSLTDVKFFYKIQTGIYVINPFIWIGKRVRSNAEREFLQKTWENLVTTGVEISI